MMVTLVISISALAVKPKKQFFSEGLAVSGKDCAQQSVQPNKHLKKDKRNFRKTKVKKT